VDLQEIARPNPVGLAGIVERVLMGQSDIRDHKRNHYGQATAAICDSVRRTPGFEAGEPAKGGPRTSDFVSQRV
jgi:hypothetical protein